MFSNYAFYFSLRKISGLLCKNTAFFSVYNCAVLTNDKSIITQIEEWCKDKQNKNLNNIPNIIYSLNSGEKIIKTITSLACGLGCVGAVCATTTSLSTSKKPKKPFIIKSGNPVITSSKTAGSKVVPDEYFNINEEYGE